MKILELYYHMEQYYSQQLHSLHILCTECGSVVRNVPDLYVGAVY